MKDENYFNGLAERTRDMRLSDMERNQAQEAVQLLAALLSRERCTDSEVNETLREAISTLCAAYGLVAFGRLPQDSDGRFVGLTKGALGLLPNVQ